MLTTISRYTILLNPFGKLMHLKRRAELGRYTCLRYSVVTPIPWRGCSWFFPG